MKTFLFFSGCPTTLAIEIISGQNLPRSGRKDILDPYVSLKVLGYSKDNCKFRTKHVEDNGVLRHVCGACESLKSFCVIVGLNPIWNESWKTSLTMPELDVLYLMVKDKDRLSSDDVVAWYSLPILSLEQGSRQLNVSPTVSSF